MARTAVVAGTATAVSNRVSRRQAARWQGQENQAGYGQQPYAEPPYQEAPRYEPPPSTAAGGGGGDDLTADVQRLASLHEQGLLTEAEFTAAKSKLLGI